MHVENIKLRQTLFLLSLSGTTKAKHIIKYKDSNNNARLVNELITKLNINIYFLYGIICSKMDTSFQ
jgi:hypothetical protein